MKLHKLFMIGALVCLATSFNTSSVAETDVVKPKTARLMAKHLTNVLRDDGYKVRRKGRVVEIEANNGPIVLEMPSTVKNLDESKTTFNLDLMEPSNVYKAGTLADYKILQNCINSANLIYELKLLACDLGDVNDPLQELLCKTGPTFEAILSQLYCIAQFDAADEE